MLLADPHVAEVLALLYYYLAENLVPPETVYGVDQLCLALGLNNQLDYFIFRVLVYQKPQSLPTAAQGRCNSYYLNTLRLLAKRQTKSSTDFRASSVGCFALAAAVDPGQLQNPEYLNLAKGLLANFSAVSLQQDRCAVLTLFSVMIQSQFLPDHEATIERLLGETENDEECQGLLLEICLQEGNRSFSESQALTILYKTKLELPPLYTSIVFQSASFLPKFIHTFVPDRLLGGRALSLCMQEYLRLRIDGDSRNDADIAYLTAFLDSLDLDPFIFREYESDMSQMFEWMIDNSIICETFMSRYMENRLVSLQEQVFDDFRDFQMFFVHCTANLSLSNEHLSIAESLIHKLIAATKRNVSFPTSLILILSVFLHQHCEICQSIKKALQNRIEEIDRDGTNEDNIALAHLQELYRVINSPPPQTPFPGGFQTLVEEYNHQISTFLHSEDVRALATFIGDLTSYASGIQLSHLPLDFFDVDPIGNCTLIFALHLKHHLEELRRLRDAGQPVHADTWKEEARLLLELVNSGIVRMCLGTSQGCSLLLILSTIGEVLYQAFEDTNKEPLTRTVLNSVYHNLLQVFVTRCSPAKKEEKWVFNTIVESNCLNAALDALDLDKSCLQGLSERVYFSELGSNVYGVTIFGGFIVLHTRLRTSKPEHKCLQCITLVHEIAHCCRHLHSTFYDAQYRTPPSEKQSGCPGAEHTYRVLRDLSECGDDLEEALFGCRITQLSNSQVTFLSSMENWKKLPFLAFRKLLHSLAAEGGAEGIKFLARKVEAGLIALRDRCRCKGN